MARYATCIGSREAPKWALAMGRAIGYQLAKRNVTVRSGSALGMDIAFEQGVIDRADITGDELMLESWLPKNGSNGRNIYARPGKYHVPTEEQFELAERILHETKVCNYQDKLPEYTLRLFRRNVFQVLGEDMEPSEAIVFWGEVTKTGNVKGGTRIAVNLGKFYEVPCYNLNVPEDIDKFCAHFDIDKELIV